MKLALGMLLPLAMGAAPYPCATGPGCGAGQSCPAPGQFPPGMPSYHLAPNPLAQACPPIGPPAPLLAGRVIVPAGVKVTVQPGGKEARTFPAPVEFGFRPGYVYRLALSDIPGHPGRTLYPVVEVRGSIVPRPGMKYMEFPAPIYFTQDDLEKVLVGGFITKVVYLEDPTRAVPIESKPDQPIESSEPTVDDALLAARDNGRIAMIVRLGDRVPDAQELAHAALPGIVLMPGDSHLAACPVPPLFAAHPIPLFDPILGPKPPTEECFTDGGDVGPRLGIGPRLRLGGLNPTDVALEYTILGRRRVATSNQVCICSPRFVIRRADILPGGLLGVKNLDALKQAHGGVVIEKLTPVLAVENRVKPVGAEGRVRPGIMISRQGVEEFVGLVRPQLLASLQGVQVLAKSVEVEEITNFPNELTVTKSVEPTGPVKPGDEVTFTITYRNGTFHPVSDLMLSDSLSGRLAYVPGSAAADRPSNVTTTENEAGSVVVQFEIPGPIPPGQSGVVKFRAKVR